MTALDPAAPETVVAAGGLTEAEAARRLEASGPPRGTPTSRSYASIVRANTLTIFNGILAAFGALTLAFGDWRDALFLGILVANAVIGIAQEVRAKRALDRLALLVAPTARVVRDGRRREIAVAELVAGDLVALGSGDQIVADGRLAGAEGLRVDESVVTGESRPVARGAGDELRSGAFVVEGSGTMVVDAVGADSYAHRLLGEARSFRHPRSPLERAVNRLLLATLALVIGLGALLGYSLWHHQAGVSDAVATATAGVVSLVPEGLVLLVSLTFAVGAVRMARRGVLAQQLNAIESLASADIICMDKTGTLTEAQLRVVELLPAAGVAEEQLAEAIGAYAASDPAPNGTLRAIGEGLPEPPRAVTGQVAFSSRRRWSGLAFDGAAYVLGAPEVVAGPELGAVAAERQRAGRRVVALASTNGGFAPTLDDDEPVLPGDLRPVGVIVLAEQLREQARETVRFLLDEGVQVKVLSGDAPETVAAIAADVGLPAGAVLRGDDLPADQAALGDTAAEAVVIGRISPEGKRDVVTALSRRGHHVVMVGDGVNDVPALKAARLAIAQGTGTQIARSVADLVLVRGDFATVPQLIHEGRQMLRNLQRVAKLYATKSAFAAFLILTIGITSTAYPLLPRHFSLAATLTIGVPTFFLALAPSSGRWWSEGFTREVARFAIPAGVLVGVGVVSSHLFALHDLDYGVERARTIATTVLVAVGLYLVLVLEAHGRRRTRVVSLMCAVLAAVFVVVVAVPGLRAFFDLASPTVGMVATAVVASLLSIGALAAAGFAPGGPTAAEPERPAG